MTLRNSFLRSSCQALSLSAHPASVSPGGNAANSFSLTYPSLLWSDGKNETFCAVSFQETARTERGILSLSYFEQNNHLGCQWYLAPFLLAFCDFVLDVWRIWTLRDSVGYPGDPRLLQPIWTCTELVALCLMSKKQCWNRILWVKRFTFSSVVPKLSILCDRISNLLAWVMSPRRVPPASTAMVS